MLITSKVLSYVSDYVKWAVSMWENYCQVSVITGLPLCTPSQDAVEIMATKLSDYRLKRNRRRIYSSNFLAYIT